MSEQFVVVTEPGSEDPVELPTNADDSSLSANTLERAFPGAHGLKYKNPTTGAFRALLLDETGTKFLPPADGWEGKIFTIVMRPPSDESEHGKKRKKNGEGEESSESSDDDAANGNGERKKKSKKLRGEDKAVCSDLIVLGLPYKLTDAELKDYFEQFGTVLLSEVKKSPSGESRGFGFIQMGDYADQIRVLAKPNHLIGGRKCQVRMPLSKNGEVREPNLILNPKLFVTRLPERATIERLNEYFTEQVHKLDPKASVLDVYIPKPFRGFSFITLSSPAVAKEMIRQCDFIFDGASIAVTAAVPRDTTKPKPPPPGYAPRGVAPYADSPRMGPRNGPVAPVYGGGGDYNSSPYDYEHRGSSGYQRYESRYYDNKHSSYGGADARDAVARGSSSDDVMGMNPEVMTAAFKAFLSAAQQSMTGAGGSSNGAGGGPHSGGPSQGGDGGSGAPGYDLGGYNAGGMIDGGNPQWR